MSINQEATSSFNHYKKIKKVNSEYCSCAMARQISGALICLEFSFGSFLCFKTKKRISNKKKENYIDKNV
jgi:hypothetical protein